MPNKQGIDHDGTTFNVYSDDVPQLKTPIPHVGVTPSTWAGQDTDTGLLAYFTQPGPEKLVPLDTGEDPPGDAVTIPTQPKITPVVAPTPLPDNCPEMRCGAAHEMAYKLVDEYTGVLSLLHFMLSAPFNVILGTARRSASAITLLLKDLLRWLTKAYDTNPVVLTVLAKLLGAVYQGTVAGEFEFEAIDDAGQEQLALLAYLSLECSENTFKLTTTMLGNWGARILRDDVDFTEWQRHLLVYCIQATPFYVYDLTAASGAQNPSAACTEWTGP